MSRSERYVCDCPCVCVCVKSFPYGALNWRFTLIYLYMTANTSGKRYLYERRLKLRWKRRRESSRQTGAPRPKAQFHTDFRRRSWALSLIQPGKSRLLDFVHGEMLGTDCALVATQAADVISAKNGPNLSKWEVVSVLAKCDLDPSTWSRCEWPDVSVLSRLHISVQILRRGRRGRRGRGIKSSCCCLSMISDAQLSPSRI